MLCVPHPQKPGHTLVLLDTEGLGDVEKVQLNFSNSTHVVSVAHHVFYTPKPFIYGPSESNLNIILQLT